QLVLQDWIMVGSGRDVGVGVGYRIDGSPRCPSRCLHPRLHSVGGVFFLVQRPPGHRARRQQQPHVVLFKRVQIVTHDSSFRWHVGLGCPLSLAKPSRWAPDWLLSGLVLGTIWVCRPHPRLPATPSWSRISN